MRAESIELGSHLARQHAEVAGVDTHRAQAGTGCSDRVGHPVVHVIGIDEQGGGDSEGGDLGAERRLLPFVGRTAGVRMQHREGVGGGAHGGNAIAVLRGQIGAAGEAGDVGGAGGGDSGLFMGASRAHLNQRAAVSRTDHPGRSRCHGGVMIEDRQCQRLQQDAFGERSGNREHRGTREIQFALGVTVDIPAEPEITQIVQRRRIQESGHRRQGLIVEDEVAQRFQEPAGPGDHAVAAALG